MEHNYNVVDKVTGEEWRWYDSVGDTFAIVRPRGEPNAPHRILPLWLLADSNRIEIKKV